MTHARYPHDEPDPQSLLDFGDALADGTAGDPANELEATMLRVQRGLHATSPDHDTMPDDVRTRIREELMHADAPPADIAGQHPGSSAPRPRARRRQPLAPMPRQHLPRMAWTGAANIALAVMILVAAFGAWRLYDDSFGGGDGNTPGDGQYAYAPITSTPEQSEVPAIIPSPEVVPESAFACDFSEDIPNFPDVSLSPVEQTSLYLTPRFQVSDNPTGTLMLHCPEEPQDIELARRVMSTYPGPIPGVLMLSVLPEGAAGPADQIPAYVNVTTGRMVAFGISEGAMQLGLASAPGSPWALGQSSDDPSVMQVLNLRTMETSPLPDAIDSDVVAPEQMKVSGASESGTLAVNFHGADHVEVDPATGTGTVTPGKTAREAGLPGDILVIDGASGTTHWITLPDELVNMRDMWLSPDGSTLAVMSFPVGEDPSFSPHTYALIDVADGSESGRSESIDARPYANPLWVQNGASFAYVAGNSLHILSVASDAAPETVLESDQQFLSLRSTGNPDVIVATIREDHGSDADPESTDVDKVYSVNIATGETHEFDGMELGNMFSQMITSTNALFMYEYAGQGDDPVDIEIYDPVTGELLQQIPDAPNPNNIGSMSIGKDSFISSPDGRTMVYTIGWQDIYVAQDQDGAPAIRVIDPPSEGRGSADVAISPDGTILSLVNNNDEGRNRWLLDLTDPAAEWLKVPNEGVGGGPGTIRFVERMGD